MKKIKNLMIAASICIFCLFGIAVTVNAQTRDYMTYETVEKTGITTVYTNSTGTNIWSVNYGATCTSGTMTIMVQGYDGGWHDILISERTLSAGESVSTSYKDPNYEYKVYRLKLSGSSARGNGYIQGR